MFLWVVYRVYFPCYEYTPVKIHVTVLSTRLRIFLGNVLEGGLGTARAAVVAGPPRSPAAASHSHRGRRGDAEQSAVTTASLQWVQLGSSFTG